MPKPIEPIQVRMPEVNIIEALPAPVVDVPEPPVISSMRPPVINMPIADLPVYEPIFINPATLIPIQTAASEQEQEEEVEEETRPSLDMGQLLEQIRPIIQQETKQAAPPPPPQTEVRAEMSVPFLGQVPVPRGEEITLAGTTAFAATGAALVGRSLLEYMVKALKPVANQFWLRLKKALGRDFTDYELQLFFLFESKDGKGKRIEKRLKQEQEEERLRQFRRDGRRLHQNTLERTETEDGTSHQLSMPPRSEEV